LFLLFEQLSGLVVWVPSDLTVDGTCLFVVHVKYQLQTNHGWFSWLMTTINIIRYLTCLVGGLEHFLFLHILGIMIPTDDLIFFRGVGLNHQPDVHQRNTQHPAVLAADGPLTGRWRGFTKEGDLCLGISRRGIPRQTKNDRDGAPRKMENHNV